MSSLIDNDDEFARGDREVNLSTGAILGIFLGLVLLCGVFFGFGYKMGSHKPGPPTEGDASLPVITSNAPQADFNAFKPAAGSPAGGGASKGTVIVHGGGDSATSPAASTAAATHPATAAAPTLRTAPAPIVRATPPPSAATLAASLAAAPAAVASGNFVVQVAAVSLQEDADLLAGALRSKGYTVSAHAQPDKLIHIQVGPFSNRKDAESMRQRLLGDGYNAIVK